MSAAGGPRVIACALPGPVSYLRDAREVATHRVFFPLAMLLAAVEIPIWVGLYRTRPDLGPWHAHEMLFGYALAVVAGFLLTPLDRRLLAGLVAMWLLARLALAIGWPVLGGIAALGFTWGVTGLAAARFLRGARKGRNRIFVVLLLGMGAAEALFLAGGTGLLDGGAWRGILLMLDLVSLIMLQMGGRVIPAATAGALHRRNLVLRDRVQPWVETAIGAAMLVVVLGDQLPALAGLGGEAGLLAAILAGLRLLRWRGWLIWRSVPLAALHLGYVWLVVGLGLKAAAAFLPGLPLMAGIHALGIGALGCLTVTMMLRTDATRQRSGPMPSRRIAWAVMLLSLAGALRIAAAFDGNQHGFWAAAGFWTAAILVTASRYATDFGRRGGRHTVTQGDSAPAYPHAPQPLNREPA